MKKTLYILTLEPIEKRYTKQWYKYFKKEFSKYFNVKYIDGTIFSDEIKVGRFLDVNQTNIWKAEQVIRMGELFQDNKIKNGNKFLFMDGWHFGITALDYMAKLNNIKIDIYSYWHAGSWDKWDFITQAGLGETVRGTELSWLTTCKRNFVATKFHKDLILNMFGMEHYRRINVVGFPMDWKKEVGNRVTEKEDIVVFPHRVDKEKSPEVFDRVAKHFPNYKFIKTIQVTKNKQEYYDLLSKAKIVFSASKQETFGIGTVEAMMLDCIPVVPVGLAYDELYNTMFQYNGIRSAVNKISWFMKYYNDYRIQNYLKRNKIKINNQSKKSIKRMAMVMMQ